MLSDSSNSDTSPIKNKRKTLKIQETSESDDDHESPIVKRKTLIRRRVSSSSDSSGSCIVGPSHKKTKVISESESESCSSSSDSEVEEVFRPWSSNRPKSRSLLQSDSESASEEYSSNGKQSKTRGNGDLSSDNDDGEKCIICFKAFRGVIAHPSGCTHNFHSECLLTWSKTSNTCPIDRVKYTEVIVTGLHGEVTRHDVITPPPQDHNNDIEPDDTTFCEVCNQHDRENEMLLCDRCEAGYHLNCLNPPLEEVPIGDWFCPDCTSLQHDIGDDEVRDLLRGTILIESRLRGRPNVNRPPRIGPRTRAAQRVISSIREMANQNELSRPSVSTSRRPTNQPTRRVKKRRRRRRTHYNVELITTESGATIEVKVAVNTRRRRKKKRKPSCKGRSKAKDIFSKMALPKNSETASNNFRRNLNELVVQPLDIFGSRPQLEYFSGCEAEDELDEEGGGGLGLLRLRNSVMRPMANRKQLAAQVLRSAPRRPIPRVGLATAPPDLISSILDQQEKWHSPNAVIKSNSKGEVKVALHGKNDKIPVKKSVGSEGKTSSTSGTNNQNLQKEGSATPQQSNGESAESVPPLQPPPQPIFSRAYDDEDFDLYADIEAPVEPPLAPPPEPPALLLAMEGDEAASSPEDAMLVIDDRQTYDPDIPTSPPPSPEKPDNKMEIDMPVVTDDSPSINIGSAQIPLPPRIPSPTNEDDIDDCPNRVMYSEASVNIARETKSDSETEEPDVTNSNVLINIDTVQDVSQKQDGPDNLSDTDINIMDDDKENPIVTGDNQNIKDNESVGEDMIDVSKCDITEKKETETCENLNTAAISECNLEISDEAFEKDLPAKKDSTSKKAVTEESSSTENSTSESKKHAESDTDDDNDVSIDLEKISEGENSSPKEQLCNKPLSQVGLKGDSPTLSVDEKDKESDDVDIVKVIGSESGDEVERKCQDDWSRESSPSRRIVPEKGEGEGKCHDDDWSRESSPSRRIIPEKDEGEDVLELGCGDDERDGLVDITDEEISTYEKSWELEDNNAPTDKTIGIEGLETEAISDCEYNIVEDAQAVAPRTIVDNGPKEEGEIITEERRAPVAWKKISKSTKERSYREKEASAFKEKTKKKEKKPKEKRKELERYDVRKIISDKPKKRKLDEFGRDISPSRSRSLSDSRSRSVSRRRSRSRSVKKRRSRDRRSRNRSRARSRGRSRPKSRDKRSRGRSKSRSRSGSRRRRSRSPRKNKERRSRAKSKEKKRRKRESSISCSSCSCSSCEQERRKSKKLTVIVPNKLLGGGSTKEKKKGKYKDRTEGKRRRVDSPVPSKEVFTSGDNILVSVNFKSSKSGETSRKEPSKKKKDEETKKKKDKGSKENQPLRSIVSKSSSNQPGQKKGKINSKNLKPVAIIDLAQSPFREQTLSPKEIIVLTDSDSDDKRKPDENNIPSCQVTGPKTPPEPHIKFNIINSKPQMLRSLVNPLLDSSDQLEGDVDDEEDDRVEIPHKGPNTPPEPPVPYDPFEPTKSRSPTPLQELEECRNATPPTEKNLPIEPPQRPVSPPKPPPESPKTPSPLHSPPPKPAEHSTPEKAHLSPPNDCNDDSMDMGGGDSPYSPGSSEADDLFDAPTAQMNTSTPIAKVKPRQIQQKHPQKLTSPLKRKPASSKSTSKTSKASNKKESSKLDEDQLKILDDLPNSAVEMQVKDKFLKKLNRQERVVEEVKMVLKPHYAKKHVTKEEYKDILRKSVPKICHSRSGEINPIKIQRLIEAYVKKYRHLKKKRKPAAFSAPESLQPLKPKGKQTLWC